MHVCVSVCVCACVCVYKSAAVLLHFAPRVWLILQRFFTGTACVTCLCAYTLSLLTNEGVVVTLILLCTL